MPHGDFVCNQVDEKIIKRLHNKTMILSTVKANGFRLSTQVTYSCTGFFNKWSVITTLAIYCFQMNCGKEITRETPSRLSRCRSTVKGAI